MRKGRRCVLGFKSLVMEKDTPPDRGHLITDFGGIEQCKVIWGISFVIVHCFGVWVGNIVTSAGRLTASLPLKFCHGQRNGSSSNHRFSLFMLFFWGVYHSNKISGRFVFKVWAWRIPISSKCCVNCIFSVALKQRNWKLMVGRLFMSFWGAKGRCSGVGFKEVRCLIFISILEGCLVIIWRTLVSIPTRVKY